MASEIYLGVKITNTKYALTPKPWIDLRGHLDNPSQGVVTIELSSNTSRLTLDFEQFSEFMKVANEILERVDVNKMEKIL